MVTHLIFGCGYLGHRVAMRWRRDGRPVAAVTRSPQRAQNLAADGLSPVIADVTKPDSLANLPASETVLYAVGFDRAGKQSIEQVYVNGLANVLDALPAPAERLIYVSSTGVYGQTDGGWVDEDSPCAPGRAGGRACLAAEQLLLDSPLADRCVILRCAGLYGPGRIPRLSDVQANQPIRANPDAYLNLIHVDDAADIVCRVAEIDPPSRLYLVSDGHPAPRRDFYNALAKRNGMPPPKFAPPEAADDERRAGGDNKRISNRRLMREIQPQLNYPSYLAGLAALEI